MNCTRLLFCSFLLLAIAGTAFSYEVVFKNGNVIQGKLVSESEDTIFLKDSKGVLTNIPKADVDLQKTAERNKEEKSSKKPANLVTKEDLEKLRDKYDLGAGSFGESEPLDLTGVEEYVAVDSDFDTEVLQASEPVMVDFWASWCQPCRVISPRVDAVAEEFKGKAKVYKVDVDKHRALAFRYKITAIPSLLFFKDGKVVERIVGAVPQNKIEEILSSVVAEHLP